MTSSLYDTLRVPFDVEDDRVCGVVTAVVTNNKDPKHLGRVKLRLPWLSDKDETDWVRVAVLMAGKERGTFMIPEVEDEVLVAFEHGDRRFPYVVGSLWNESQPPPETNDDGKNDRRVIRSRSGHLVLLNDKEDEESIEIVDKSEKNSIVISTRDNTVTIKADADITIESTNGKVILKAAKGVEIATDDAMKVETMKDIEIKATGGKVTVKGTTIELN